MTLSTVSDAIADELAQHDVDRVFGLPGGEVLHLMDALRRRRVEYTLFRHESDAGIAAAIYGKLKGTAGVVLTTLGPGASNLLLPVASSLLDREPLVAISAQLSSTSSPMYTHQRLPLADIFRPVTKHTEAATPFTGRATIRRAVAAATTEPQGPSFVTLSADDAVAISHETAAGSGRRPPVASEPIAPAADRVKELLAKAERPLILIGLGALASDAAAIRRWIREWHLPVAVTPKVKGVVDETEPTFVGVISGMAIDDLMVEALRSADVLIGLGLDPVEIDKRWHVELPIHWVLSSPWATGLSPKEHISADAGALAGELASSAPPRRWEAPFGAIIAKRRRYIDEACGEELSPVRIVTALAEVFPPETTVTTDVGSHKYLLGQFWPSRQPGTFFMSNGLSGMGYGLPAGIGAKLARPSDPVLVVMGDGGFSMNSQELDTARRLGAPIIVVVITDNSYSLIRIGQENRKLPNYGVDFDPIDTVLTARACGVDGVRASSASELKRCVSDGLRSGASLVVEVPLSPERYRGIV
jgi:acetolactate synthase I/II/III large subunit